MSGGDGETVVTVAGYGGVYEEMEYDAFFDGYMAEHPDVRIVYDELDMAKLKAMVESGNPTWDIFLGGPESNDPADIFEKIDCEKVPCSELKMMADHGYSVPYYIFSTVLAYREDAFGGKAPENWADFFDLETFPGKRGLWNAVTAGTLEPALLADGVAHEDLYPLDTDRALAKLGSIRDSIVWWESGAQCGQLLRDNEVVMANCWSLDVDRAQADGAPLGIAWSDNFMLPGEMSIVKGTTHRDIAMDIIAYSTSAEVNAGLAELGPFTPANEAAWAELELSPESNLSAAHADTAAPHNVDRWIDFNAERLTKLLQEWILG
ncbi:hypothetical protein ASJ79_15950 [Mycobacterium sp. NAZ190054]|nr:hypothetical protein ASJ79_15950 [Mycobacterium sp. NAZ190054]